ncbi:MAG: FRG domain-containing protein [Actinobacteria bacterium]|nr:FRG domain-containing protein [Actinomycetota bacterium]
MSFWSDRRLLEGGGDAEDLLNKVARITTWSTECQFVWRGHPDQEWPLHSALFGRVQHAGGAPPNEDELRAVEQDLIASASARRMGGDATTPDLQRLAVLQHHGTATRLLDVTTDPMIALWFACEDRQYWDRPGVLFAVEVSNAQHLDWTHEDTISTTVDSLEADQLAVYWPEPLDARIQVQRGAFVFGRVPDDGGTRTATSMPIRLPDWTAVQRRAVFGVRGRGRPTIPSILAVRIPKHTKQRLLALLERSYGYTEETIYPDIDGFSRANGRLSPL